MVTAGTERKQASDNSSSSSSNFLLTDSSFTLLLTPEDFAPQQRAVADAAGRFIEDEVVPRLAEMERHEWQAVRALMQRAAQLGLVCADLPAEYGGGGGGRASDETNNLLITETIGQAASFAIAFGAQTGIGMLPILHFGTVAAKRKYLPRIATGTLITAYALTEAGAGSDAFAAKTHAQLNRDGTHYILNGEKKWIGNAGFADIFVVFAAVGEKKLSGFIVERDANGVRIAAEEQKMGLKGASTCSVILSDVRVPVENLLGEAGGAAKIALNTLNIGRLRLGASCLGHMKSMLKQSVRYANERYQFGQPISSFGAIQAKLAEMAIRTWAGETIVYRTTGLIEALTGGGKDAAAKLAASAEYAAECSIVKVILSEYCCYVADEMVQIYGGNGYSAAYPAESAYRDARINRIFEGTNEINRLLITRLLVKRAGGHHAFLRVARERLITQVASSDESVAGEAEGEVAGDAASENVIRLHQLARSVETAKSIALLTLSTTLHKYEEAELAAEQQILIGVADIIMEAYVMESILLRTQRCFSTQTATAATAAAFIDMTTVYCNDALQRIEMTARNTLAAMAAADSLRELLARINGLTGHTPSNTAAARRRIAAVLINANGYCF